MSCYRKICNAVPNRRSGSLHRVEEHLEEAQEGDEEEEIEEEEGSGADAFHSLRHVKPFAKEAARALDQVAGALRKGSHTRRGTAATDLHR